MSCPNKRELLTLIEDRKNDLPRASLELHRPRLQTRDDLLWRTIRERERTTDRQRKRLQTPKTKLDRDFDMNS